MNWVFLEIHGNTFPSPSQQLYFQPLPPPPQLSLNSQGFNLNSKVSPSVLLIIIILAIVFFFSCLLHLLVRFLLRAPNRDPDDLENATAFEGQLQQLFNLHDAGVDQTAIDSLPVFPYKTIIGLKNPLDCAVCLCEFESEDKLRLLPKCSHAFHLECIDTWLLSHSTCPLCRTSLLSDFSPNTSCSPVVHVLESESESSRGIANDRESNFGRASSVFTSDSHLDCHEENELGSSHIDVSNKSCENLSKGDSNATVAADIGQKILPVKLGKFKNVDIGEESSNSEVDARRCYSMGSFEYILDEDCSLQVPVRFPMKKQRSRKPALPLKACHRPTVSECGCESSKELVGYGRTNNMEANGCSVIITDNSDDIGGTKGESFPISRIWLRGKKEKHDSTQDNSSRRAISFRFPENKNTLTYDDLKAKDGPGGARRTHSEMVISRWENAGSEVGCNEENSSCNISDSQAKTPSFARRTLFWLMGRQNKIVHSSFTPDV